MSIERRPIPGFEGRYEAASDGSIYSVRRVFIHESGYEQIIPEKQMTTQLTETGYYRVALTTNGRSKSYRAHRLVAAAFLPNPENLPEVNHLNADRTDNRVSNLEWCTKEQNRQHAVRLRCEGVLGPRSASRKLNPEGVTHARRAFRDGAAYKQIADAYGVSVETIRDAIRGKTWSAVPDPVTSEEAYTLGCQKNGRDGRVIALKL